MAAAAAGNDAARRFLGEAVSSTPAVVVALISFLGTLLAIHVDRRSGVIARAIVTKSAKQLPEPLRADHEAEWIDHIASAGEHGLVPLTRAISIALIAAPTLAVGLRIGRKRSRA